MKIDNTFSRIHELLETSDRHNKEVLDMNPGMVIIKDNNDKIVWCNVGTLKETGLTSIIDLIGHSPSEFLKFVPKNKYELIDRLIIQDSKPKLDLIEMVTTPILTKQVMRIDKIPFIDPDTNECLGVVTYIINVTKALTVNLKAYINDIEYQALRAETKVILTKIKLSNHVY